MAKRTTVFVLALAVGGCAPRILAPADGPQCRSPQACASLCDSARNAAACYEAARLVEAEGTSVNVTTADQADSVTEQWEAALDYGKRACALGEGRGCTLAAYHTIYVFPLVVRGRKQAPSRTANECHEAREMQKRGCDLGDVDGCADYGVWLLGGSEVLPGSAACMTKNPAPKRESGLGYLQRGCGAGGARACYAAGELYANESTTTSESLFRKACRLGEAWGCYKAAETVEDRDPRLAAQLRRESCREVGRGCLELAAQIAHGNVAPLRASEEFEILARGCKDPQEGWFACEELWRRHPDRALRAAVEPACDLDSRARDRVADPNPKACLVLYMATRGDDPITAERALARACSFKRPVDGWCRCGGEITAAAEPTGCRTE